MSVTRLKETFALAGRKDHGLSAKALAVLHWLAWRENHETGRLDPSHDDIHDGTGLAVSTVQRALDELRAAGLVTWKGQAWKDRRGRTSNAYTLHLTVPLTFRSPNGPDGHPDRGGRSQRPGGSVTVTDEPYVEPDGEPTPPYPPRKRGGSSRGSRKGGDLRKLPAIPHPPARAQTCECGSEITYDDDDGRWCVTCGRGAAA
jgi:hypothetical protein